MIPAAAMKILDLLDKRCKMRYGLRLPLQRDVHTGRSEGRRTVGVVKLEGFISTEKDGRWGD